MTPQIQQAKHDLAFWQSVKSHGGTVPFGKALVALPWPMVKRMVALAGHGLARATETAHPGINNLDRCIWEDRP